MANQLSQILACHHRKLSPLTCLKDTTDFLYAYYDTGLLGLEASSSGPFSAPAPASTPSPTQMEGCTAKGVFMADRAGQESRHRRHGHAALSQSHQPTRSQQQDTADCQYAHYDDGVIGPLRTSPV